MKVLPVIGANSFYNSDCMRRKNVKSVAFKGTPVYMNLTSNNLDNYDRLSNGSFLDIHDDIFAPQNKFIRNHNLSFLDNIVTENEKRKFIEHYKSVTGFPNLQEVSNGIEKEFVRSVKAVSSGFYDSNYDVIAAGYDGTCSVGKGFSLPGSDLDKAFIILRGSSNNGVVNDLREFEIVNNFKNKLWFATDQRILSYNHDTSFPTVMTVNQVKETLNKLKGITDSIRFNTDKMEFNVQEEYLDLIKASKFNILVSSKLPKRKYDDPVGAMNKENIKNFAYFIESVRDGKKLITSPDFERLVAEIEDNKFFKYSNVAQMQAMKNAVNAGKEQKSKIIIRKTMKQDFESWSINKQFEFIKTLIKYSCEDQNDFKAYFTNDRNIKENYKPLLGLLCYGDRDRRLNPDFDIRKNYIDIYLSKGKPVRLYQGYAPNVLWIDSLIKDKIEDVLLHVDKLRKTQLFKNINKAQAPMPLFWELPDNFYRINFYTKTGRRIIERTLR